MGATLTRPDQPGSQQHTYTYDAAGNMVSRTVVMTTINTPTALDTNHLTGLSAAYDAAGNVVQLKPPGQAHTYQYTYDALGALQKVTVADIASATTRYNVYTADDERLWTFDGPTNTSRWTIRDLSGKVLRDYTFDFVSNAGVAVPRWQLSRDYIYRDGMLLAAVTSSSTLHFSLDHLGSPRVVTDASRLRLGFHHYLPFGEEWLVNAQASDSEPMKYTGHERDGDLAGGTAATDYMHARHYTGGVGRFLSIDPGPLSRSLPQTWNRYSYVVNAPLTLTDPDGRQPCTVRYAGVNGGRPFPSECIDVIGHYESALDEWNRINRQMDHLTLKPVEVASSVSAGFGDGILATLSFGVVDGGLTGAEGAVDRCSGEYLGGRIAGTTATVLAYAGGAVPATLTHFTTKAGAAQGKATTDVIVETNESDARSSRVQALLAGLPVTISDVGRPGDLRWHAKLWRHL